jgi:hypothetical protein
MTKRRNHSRPPHGSKASRLYQLIKLGEAGHTQRAGSDVAGASTIFDVRLRRVRIGRPGHLYLAHCLAWTIPAAQGRPRNRRLVTLRQVVNDERDSATLWHASQQVFIDVAQGRFDVVMV